MSTQICACHQLKLWISWSMEHTAESLSMCDDALLLNGATLIVDRKRLNCSICFFCMWPKGFSVLWNEVQGGAGCQDGWIIETRLILWQTFLLYWVTVKTTGAPDAAVCHNPTFELCFSTPTLPCFPWAVCVWHLVCLEYIWLLCYGSQTAADAFKMNRVHMYKWWTNTC